MAEIMGQYVDRLINIEIRNRAMNIGVMGKLYRAALAEAGVGVGCSHGKPNRNQIQNPQVGHG